MSAQDTTQTEQPAQQETPAQQEIPKESAAKAVVTEIGGPKGPEPTRYGDWEQGGRCTDF